MDATAAISMFQRCLERCCARATAPRGSGGCRQAALAATCLLRLGHAGRALKLASRALFLQPQDEHRQLVRQCTKELEYQGRVEAMQAALADCGSVASMPGAAGIVARLLQQLHRAGDEGAAEALRTLAKELVRGNIDAQIAFELLRGYEQVMRFWTSSHFSDATQVLVSAGVCQLHTVLQPGVTDAELLAMATGTGQGGKRNGIRVRWPAAVLQQLVATVTSQATGSWSDMATCALRLLTLAALDPHQRQLVLSSSPTTAASTCHPAPCTQPEPAASSTAITSQPSEGDADPVTDVLSLLVDQLEATLCHSDLQSDTGFDPQGSQDGLHSSEDNLQSSQDIYIHQMFPEAPQRHRVMRSESAVGMHVPEREDSAMMHEPSAQHRPPPSVSESSEVDSWPASRYHNSSGGYGSGSGGGSSDGDCLLTQLVDACWKAAWLAALPSQGRVLLARIVSSYATGSKFDRVVLRQASDRRGTLPMLLNLYQAMRLDGSRAAEGQAADAASTPCGRLLLTALLSLCRQEPSLLRAEGFVCRQRKAPASAHRPTRSEDWVSSAQSYACSPGFPSSTASPSQTVLVPTPLLGQLVQMARQELDLFELGSAHSQQDSSTQAASRGASPYGLQGGSGAAGTSASGMLEGWVSLLTAVAQASKINARELHRCRFLDFLHDASECSSAPALAEAVETAFGMCARQCQEMTQAMFDSKSVTALLGMARYSGQPSLVLVALDRLTPLVGRCGAAEYQRIAQQPGGGVLAATHQLMLMSLAARKAKSTPDLASSGGCSTDGSSSGPAAAGCSRPDAVKHVHPWDAALAAATEVTQGITSSFMAFGAASKLPVAPPKPDFSLPQAGALRDAAQCLLLACLDRARRQFGLKPMQAPRDGYWASVRPRDLLMLERRLREDWAAAMLPKLAWQPAAAADSSKDPSEEQALRAPDLQRQAAVRPPAGPSTAAVMCGPARETHPNSTGQGAAEALEVQTIQEVQASTPLSVEQAVPAGTQVPPASPSPASAEDAAEPSTSPEPAQDSAAGQAQAPMLLRSRRSDSLEDTAHKDSCHSSLHTPIPGKVLSDILSAHDAAPCSSN